MRDWALETGCFLCAAPEVSSDEADSRVVWTTAPKACDMEPLKTAAGCQLPMVPTQSDKLPQDWSSYVVWGDGDAGWSVSSAPWHRLKPPPWKTELLTRVRGNLVCSVSAQITTLPDNSNADCIVSFRGPRHRYQHSFSMLWCKVCGMALARL